MKCFQNNQLKLQQCVMTIGAFDGIHRGHQALIRKAKTQADAYGVPLVVYTFDPPPKVYFQKQTMLTTLPEKKKFLQELGVDYTIFASFDQAYAARSVGDFIDELGEVNPQEIWVGPGFHFGNEKSGSLEELNKVFHAYQHPAVTCSAGEVISSTRIRQLFQRQQVEQAYVLLGREPYSLPAVQ